MIKLIGLVGRAGSGKTTAAKHLVENHGFVRYAFADPLKEMLVKAGICTYEELYVQKTEFSRMMLQKIGTEIFRKQVHPHFWIEKMRQAIEPILLADCGDKFIIDDIRFPEEAMLVTKLGGILVKINREDFVDATAGTEHDSERFVDLIACDRTITAKSGDIDTLIQGIEKMLGGVNV